MHKLKSKHIKLNQNERLYNTPFPIIGLTGGIATGKSTVSKLLVERGIPVIDADALVKSIYSELSTINFIAENFPSAVDSDHKINFAKLRELFFQNDNHKKLIENHIYQKLPVAFDQAVKALGKLSADFIVYDVPLLFEKGIHNKVDLSVTVYCPSEMQISRVIQRDNSTEELAQKILAAQLPIDQKKAISDQIIQNDSNLVALEQEVQKFIDLVTRDS